MQDLSIIGSEEWCEFGTLGIPAIKARVDSGAKTSSIQAANAKVFGRGGQEYVKFEINPLQDNRSINIQCEAKLVDRRTVKSSSGIAEERFVIKTPVTIGADTFDIELTLANRDTMEFRMLLGREALNGRYMVNPADSFLQKEFTEAEVSTKYASYMQAKTG